LYNEWHDKGTTDAERAAWTAAAKQQLAEWQAEARQATANANQPNVFQRAWNWLTGSQQAAIGTLPSGERVLSQLPGAPLGDPIIWRNEAGEETGRANDHTGPIYIFENNGRRDTTQWTNMQALSTRHMRTVKDPETGEYRDIAQQWRADVGGAGSWAGPNTDFQVTNVYAQTGWGGTVEVRVGDDTLRYIHLSAISDEVYNARVNGGTGAMLRGGTIVGYTQELRGNIAPDNDRGRHLHIESTNTRHTSRDILRILQGR
jgi:hypothetical protein